MKPEPLKDKQYGLTNIESWKVDLAEKAKEDIIFNTKWFKDNDVKSAVEWLKETIQRFNITSLSKDDAFTITTSEINECIDEAFEDVK